MVKIEIDHEKCTGCGTCVDICPVGVYALENEKSLAVNLDECLICRICETQCPINTIEIVN
jgi:NAD-dependent dihydropyrimidine dehydrogenase PreA subunit